MAYAYQYDNLYRLLEAQNPNSDTEKFTYDAVGNRKTTEKSPTPWLYNANYQYDPFGRRISKEVNGTTTYFFYQNDHLGTPQKLMSTTGAIVWCAKYEAFGKYTPAHLQATAQPVENPLRFAGQYEDFETGWHYNRHRYYAPELGRYITSDPIGLEGGLNTYAYALNNPIYWIDPFGLDVEVLVGGAHWYDHAALRVGNNCASTVVDALDNGLSWYHSMSLPGVATPQTLELNLHMSPFLVNETIHYQGGQ